MNMTAFGIFLTILIVFIFLLFFALLRILPVILAVVSGMMKNWKGIKSR